MRKYEVLKYEALRVSIYGAAGSLIARPTQSTSYFRTSPTTAARGLDGGLVSAHRRNAQSGADRVDQRNGLGIVLGNHDNRNRTVIALRRHRGTDGLNVIRARENEVGPERRDDPRRLIDRFERRHCKTQLRQNRLARIAPTWPRIDHEHQRRIAVDIRWTTTTPRLPTSIGPTLLISAFCHARLFYVTPT